MSVPTIGMLTAAAIVTSLRGLPLMAIEELTMFIYIAFATILFLLPGSLVSAEPGGAFADRKGGVYAWVGEAFGPHWSFLAVWLQWIQNVVWYPTAAHLPVPAPVLETHLGTAGRRGRCHGPLTPATACVVRVPARPNGRTCQLCRLFSRR